MFGRRDENAGKATLHLHSAFLYISFPSMPDFEVELPNFKFYEGFKDRRRRTLIPLSELGSGY